MCDRAGANPAGAEGWSAVRLCNWLHKAREMPKEEFRREVERELKEREEEPSELIYF